MEFNSGLLALPAVEQLYQMSSFPVVICDCNLQIYWANSFALTTYPTLSLPDGLDTLLPVSLMESLRRQAGEHSGKELEAPFMAGSARIIFTPLEDGFYLLHFSLPQKSESAFPLTGNQRVVSSFAHHFRAPLTSAFSGLSVLSNNLSQSDLPDENHLLIQSVSQNCYRMLRVSSNLTDYLRYLFGELEPQMNRVSICPFLEKLCASLAIVGGQSGIPVTYDIPKEPVILVCDKDFISNALLQLVSNSLLFTREGNAIHISVKLLENRLAITVSDRGAGIPQDQQANVFTPYFSYDAGGRPFAGIGLGLTLVKIITALHGGTVALQSTEMEGTTVTFTIPLRDDDSLTFSDNRDTVDYLYNKFSSVYIQLSDSCRCPNP